MKRFVVTCALAATAVVTESGCAQSGTRPAPAPRTREQADSAARAIAGRGTLSQNDIAVRLRNDELEIRFVPLDIRVTALLAPDAAESLQRLVARHRPSVDSAGQLNSISEPGLALVTFFSQREDVRFDPQLLTLSFQNRLLRPLGIVPLSPRFTSQQLGARETAMAIYLFEELIPVWDEFTVAYAALSSNEWARRLPTLERERARLSTR